ncbi:MAG: hypothetical protein ACRD12_21225 [Acidimicrobiales bacterium]
MSNPNLEDHLVGLELQLVELVENKQRAEVQGREADAHKLDREIGDLQAELASAAEQISVEEVAAAGPKARLAAAPASRFRAA